MADDVLTVDQFFATMPAFKDASVADVQRLITTHDRLFNISRFDEVNDYVWAASNVVAHYLTLEDRNAKGVKAPAGDITDKMAGRVRVVRAASILEKQLDNPFLATPFGREYLLCLRKARVGAVASGDMSP
jgi:hypothetical protein